MNQAPSFVTPLRYPGGKARLGHWLSLAIKSNKLNNSTYIEPYAGGAGAAIYLLANGHVNEVVINDVDFSIYCFWWALLNETDEFLKLLTNTEISMEVWVNQKKILNAPFDHSKTQVGFAAFFLNRTNRSGIIQGGVIGGKNQNGPYSMSARFNKDTLTDRIRKISSLKSKIRIYNRDALEIVNPSFLDETSEPFLYLDPPYYKKGSQLYKNHYKPEDHAIIADAVGKIKAPWIVTYDNCVEIRELYKENHSHEFSFHYSTHTARPLAKEVMFYKNLKIPSAPTMRR